MRWEKTAALLELARNLAGTAEGLTLDEMAARTGVNRRTAERMRDALRDLFPTLEEVSDGRTKRFCIPRGLDTFFRAPSADELGELDVAARALEAQGGNPRAALLRSLGDKVRATLRSRERSRIAPDLDALAGGEDLVLQAGPRPLADASTLATLREALKASRRCAFDYAGSNGFDYRRVIEPYGILFGRTYYLVGPERGKPDPVLWRLDRLSGLTLGETFDGPPAGWSLRDYAARSFGAYQEEPQAIALRFDPSAAADARRFEFHPGQVLEELEDGSLVVRFQAGGLRELAFHLFTWSDAVEILGPAELKGAMVDMLRIALSRHDVSG